MQPNSSLREEAVSMNGITTDCQAGLGLIEQQFHLVVDLALAEPAPSDRALQLTAVRGKLARLLDELDRLQREGQRLADEGERQRQIPQRARRAAKQYHDSVTILARQN